MSTYGSSVVGGGGNGSMCKVRGVDTVSRPLGSGDKIGQAVCNLRRHAVLHIRLICDMTCVDVRLREAVR